MEAEAAVAAPLEPALHPPEVPAELPAGSHEDKLRGPVEKVYRSPAEILEKISPPNMIVRLSFNDHRFKVECSGRIHDKISSLSGPYHQKSYTKSFASGALSWKQALSDVHMHAWTKYRKLVESGSMDEADSPQTPGEIEHSVLDELEPEIKKLPPVKKY